MYLFKIFKLIFQICFFFLYNKVNMLKVINNIDKTLSKNISNSTVSFVIIILGLLYIFMIKKNLPKDFK